MKKCLIVFVLIATIFLFFVSCSNNDEYNYFGTINGTITERSSGAAISNAMVILSPGGASRQTNSEGFYEFENLEPGDYSVSVQSVGYRSDRSNITVRVGENTMVNFSLLREGDL